MLFLYFYDELILQSHFQGVGPTEFRYSACEGVFESKVSLDGYVCLLYVK